MFYEPNKRPLSIDPFKSLVFPRPIGWISSVDKKGNVNLAPYSYFNAIADDPPQIMFASAAPEQKSKFKDTLTNILETKEFVVNFATSTSRTQMNLSSLGVSSSRISTVSYGKERPDVEGSFDDAWQKNRRTVTTLDVDR